MLLASVGFRIGPNDLLAQCLARPKGTAQIWFGPLPPCALDTWQFVTCWCFSELGELGFCDRLMIRWPHIQFHTGNVLGSWWLIVAVAHSCILWLALICTCRCVFCLWIYGYLQCLLMMLIHVASTASQLTQLRTWESVWCNGTASSGLAHFQLRPTTLVQRVAWWGEAVLIPQPRQWYTLKSVSSVSVCLSHPGEPHLVWLIEKDYFLMV